MRLNLLIMLTTVAFCANPAMAATVIDSSVPNASVVGQGALHYAFWNVYDAILYAPDGQWNPNKPFALSLKYHCAIDGKDIADRSIIEMRKQGFGDEIKLAGWNGQMKSIFPDVKDGTVLSAIYQPGKRTIFYEGNKVIGTIRGENFGQLFFGIWLSEKTSEPALRKALLGMS